MAIEEQHVALPKLYGAPAYARPEPRVVLSPRPFDPDDLPVEAAQTTEERELAAALPARSYAPGGAHLHLVGDSKSGDEPTLHPRVLSLRALAGRILGQIDN